MNIFERLMPQTSARRAEARLKLARAQTALAVEKQRTDIIQSYDAARTGGRASGWHRPRTSAGTEIQGAIEILRASGRDLVRNSPHGSRAVRSLAAHIAGTGVRPRAIVETDDQDAKQAIQRVTREVQFVGKRGEEILTMDDPRHRYNGGANSNAGVVSAVRRLERKIAALEEEVAQGNVYSRRTSKAMEEFRDVGIKTIAVS